MAVLLSLPWAPPEASAQLVEGNTFGTLAGAGLGAASGSALGLMGAMFPCNRRVDGRRCVVSAASVGGALGMAMGGMIGSQNLDALGTRYEGAGLGLAVGALVGLGVSAAVPQYGWYDAGAMALMGGAVGASPYGAMLGAATGAAAGTLVWAVKPDGGVQDLVLFTLAGMALGGLADWGNGASDRSRTGYTLSWSFGL